MPSRKLRSHILGKKRTVGNRVHVLSASGIADKPAMTWKEVCTFASVSLAPRGKESLSYTCGKYVSLALLGKRVSLTLLGEEFLLHFSGKEICLTHFSGKRISLASETKNGPPQPSFVLLEKLRTLKMNLITLCREEISDMWTLWPNSAHRWQISNLRKDTKYFYHWKVTSVITTFIHTSSMGTDRLCKDT
jgi:hypothetical protein